MRRISGMKIFALLAVIAGGIGVLSFFLTIINNGLPVEMSQKLFCFYIFSVLLLLLISGIGLFKMKEWARKCIMLYSISQIASYIFTFIYVIFIQHFSNYLWVIKTLGIKALFLLIPSIVIIFYFNKPSVKSRFIK